jgi:hypothetical protein
MVIKLEKKRKRKGVRNLFLLTQKRRWDSFLRALRVNLGGYVYHALNRANARRFNSRFWPRRAIALRAAATKFCETSSPSESWGCRATFVWTKNRHSINCRRALRDRLGAALAVLRRNGFCTQNDLRDLTR